jgi:hypothetical protein
MGGASSPVVLRPRAHGGSTVVCETGNRTKITVNCCNRGESPAQCLSASKPYHLFSKSLLYYQPCLEALIWLGLKSANHKVA